MKFEIVTVVEESCHKDIKPRKKLTAKTKTGLRAAVKRAIERAPEYGDLTDGMDKYRTHHVSSVTIRELEA